MIEQSLAIKSNLYFLLFIAYYLDAHRCASFGVFIQQCSDLINQTKGIRWVSTNLKDFSSYRWRILTSWIFVNHFNIIESLPRQKESIWKSWHYTHISNENTQNDPINEYIQILNNIKYQPNSTEKIKSFSFQKISFSCTYTSLLPRASK